MKSKVKIKNHPRDAERQLKELHRRMRGKGQVLVGLPKGSNNYPDGTSVVEVGVIHEFGSDARNIPQRSFLRSAMVKNRGKYKKLFRKLAKEIVDGKSDKRRALGIVGLTAMRDVKDRITDLKSPPLANKFRKDGSVGNPLVDTGHLRQAITYVLEEKL